MADRTGCGGDAAARQRLTGADLPSGVRLLATRLAPLDQRWPPAPSAGQRLPGRRQSAVLALLTAADDPDLVLTERAATLRHHAGQISFPGGGREPTDDSPAATALREAREEIGLGSERVHLLGQLRPRDALVSANRVVPVVGLWPDDGTVGVRDPHEVESVLRWSLADLADPSHRLSVRHPGGGTGPAWRIGGLVMCDRVIDVPPRFRRDLNPPAGL